MCKRKMLRKSTANAKPWSISRNKLLVSHASPHDSVKQHLKSSLGLGAMLYAEAEHHDLAFALGEAYDRGLTFQAFGAVGVAGDQNVLGIIGIPGDHRALHVGRRRGGLEGDGAVVKRGHLVRHPVTHGMVGVDVDTQQRAGNVEVRRLYASSSLGGGGERVAHRQVELFAHNRVRGAGQRDERATFLYKVVQRAQALLADTTCVFRRKVFSVSFAALAAVDDDLARGVGKNDHVVAVVEIAGLYFFVLDVLQVELVLLEDKPGPSLIERCDVRFVESDADGVERHSGFGQVRHGVEKQA